MYATQEILQASRKEAVKMVRENLNQSEAWVIRAIEVVFENQTRDEQTKGVTKEGNGIGFSALDAHFCSSLAKQIAVNKITKKYKNHLSEKQMAAARKKMKKYAGQVLDKIISKNPASENEIEQILNNLD